MKRLPVSLLILGIILTGCDTKQQSSVSLAPAPSSNEALVRALDAIDRRDREAMLSLVSGGPQAQDFFASLIDSLKTVDAFRRKFIDTYGEDAWTAFQAPLPQDQKRPDMNLKIPDLGQIKRDSSAWDANAGNHGVFDKLPGVPIPFVQEEGGWVIDGTKVFPDEKTRAGFIGMHGRMTDFVKSYTKAIGHPGISPEDIDYQMGKEVMAILMGGELKANRESPNPDRFKLDQL